MQLEVLHHENMKNTDLKIKMNDSFNSIAIYNKCYIKHLEHGLKAL